MFPSPTVGFGLLLAALACAVLVFRFVASREIPRTQLTLLIFFPIVGAYLGGRLFHIVLERPLFYVEHPSAIWERNDGRTFYGAFIGGTLILSVMLRWLLPLAQRSSVWDAAAISVAIGGFFLRLACFAAGCCWGSITSLPWAAIYYDASSEMPLLGVPVHPVQVYDALLSLLLAALLIAWRQRFAGQLIYIWGVGYAFFRFCTEPLRADGDRGLGSWPLQLSNSQVISIVLLAICMWLYRSQRPVLAA